MYLVVGCFSYLKTLWVPGVRHQHFYFLALNYKISHRLPISGTLFLHSAPLSYLFILSNSNFVAWIWRILQQPLEISKLHFFYCMSLDNFAGQTAELDFPPKKSSQAENFQSEKYFSHYHQIIGLASCSMQLLIHNIKQKMCKVSKFIFASKKLNAYKN